MRFYVREHCPVDSRSRWSSVVIAAKVAPEVAKAVLEAHVGLKIQMKK